MIITIISVVLILTGLLFFFSASVGMIRFPDFYTRCHAAGKGDTLSSMLVLCGCAVYLLRDFHDFAHDWPTLLVVLKLLGVSVFILFTSPTSTHALSDAGWEDNNQPEIKEGRPNHLRDDYDQF